MREAVDFSERRARGASLAERAGRKLKKGKRADFVPGRPEPFSSQPELFERNCRMTNAIFSTCVSSTKCPESRNRTVALELSCR
jgi:hypothetical protein